MGYFVEQQMADRVHSTAARPLTIVLAFGLGGVERYGGRPPYGVKRDDFSRPSGTAPEFRRRPECLPSITDMKTFAAVLRNVTGERPYSHSKPVTLEEVSLPGPRPGEILVRIEAAGV